MSDTGKQHVNTQEIDLRELPRNQGHRMVFEAYEALNIDDALLVTDDQQPEHLHEEFDREFAGSFSWETLSTKEDEYRIRITKRAGTALPRVVADTTELLTDIAPDAQGSIWRLEPGARDLDSNIIALPANDEIAQHVGPNLDVLILVLQGSGVLHTELDVVELQPGALLWLPSKAQRRFVAGSAGLHYFSVHQRKPTLNISTKP